MTITIKITPSSIITIAVLATTIAGTPTTTGEATREAQPGNIETMQH